MILKNSSQCLFTALAEELVDQVTKLSNPKALELKEMSHVIGAYNSNQCRDDVESDQMSMLEFVQEGLNVNHTVEENEPVDGEEISLPPEMC